MRFSRLTTIEYLGCKNDKTPTWRCKCDCGNIVDIFSHHLKNDTKSCGCLKIELCQKDEIQCKSCKNIYPSSNFYKKGPNIKTFANHCKLCLSKINTYKRRKRNILVKYQVLSYYSGAPPKCQCCNELFFEFLTIDHIKGGGTKHRKEIGQSSGRIYRWLRDNKYPEGYQVLCMNCNHAKGLFGYCPHREGHQNEFISSLY